MMTKLNQILIASSNKHKKEKLSWIVKDFFKQIDFPESLTTKIKINENGKTFEENAAKKAVAYSQVYPGFTIATDGGVLIPALGEKWNKLKTRRFVGENSSDIQRIETLLNLMKDKKGEERKMIWNEAVAIAKEGKLLFSYQAEGIEGILQNNFDPAKYREGIWVCSVWYFPQYNKNFFDLGEKETKEVEISWEKIRRAIQDYLTEYLRTLS